MSVSINSPLEEVEYNAVGIPVRFQDLHDTTLRARGLNPDSPSLQTDHQEILNNQPGLPPMMMTPCTKENSSEHCFGLNCHEGPPTTVYAYNLTCPCYFKIPGDNWTKIEPSEINHGDELRSKSSDLEYTLVHIGLTLGAAITLLAKGTLHASSDTTGLEYVRDRCMKHPNYAEFIQ